jgi:hypothetical protein
MLSVTYKPFMLSVIMLNVVILSVIMLNVVILTVTMLSVVAPILMPSLSDSPYGAPLG